MFWHDIAAFAYNDKKEIYSTFTQKEISQNVKFE